MKRLLLAVTLLLGGLTSGFTQDAGMEQRLNKLAGQIEDLLAASAEQDKRIAALVRELQSLREVAGRPDESVSREELRKLAERVQEVDRKRESDRDLILKEIEKLGKTIAAPSRPVTPAGGGAARAEKGFEYAIQPGDTLSGIVAACREQGVRVTVDQILKANEGLKPEGLRVGQKIFIPGGN